jgi:transcriptional regulator with XRE-family HTH domain
MKTTAEKQLEKLRGEPFSFGSMMKAFRAREELTQEELAKKLGVTKSYISNIENNREVITVEQAIKFSKKLKEPASLWVEIALQDILNRAGFNAKVKLVA